jgi:alkylhydroperoxidase/carboxymuconolactone decarboxylase family protein YurZ
MAEDSSSIAARLPSAYKEFVAKFPELGEAHERVAHAVDAAGPLDRKTLSLIKIGICVGAGLESAIKSHVRRALDNGATEAEIEQAVLLGMNTCGFPKTVAAWSWVRQQFARDR